MKVEDFQENYGNGWIKLYRSIKNHWILEKTKPLTFFEAWIFILLEVNHSGQELRIGYDILKCERGESLNSLDTWAKIFHWHKSKVRRFFKLLEKDSMIELKKCEKTTHLKVCNYELYQGERNTSETQTKRKRNASETQVTPNKNVKKEKNVNNVKNKEEIKFNFKKSFLELGLDEQILNDWMEVRKKKKASNTKTAFTKFITQVNLSGLTVNECVKICAEKDWKGFEAKWLENINSNGNGITKKQPATTIEDLIEINKKHFG